MTGGAKTNCTSLVKKDHDEKTDQTADFSTASTQSGHPAMARLHGFA
jgi:hypothetical protein